MTWRYVGFSEPDGTYLGELTLVGANVARVLSGPGRLTGMVPSGLVPDWLSPWHCSVYAEDEAGNIRGGGFLTPVSVSESGVQIDCVGRSGYPSGMPWTAGPYSGVRVDPLDLVRMIWAHLQSQPGGGIGVVVDDTRSPVRVGEPEEDVNFQTSGGRDVSFQAGPYTVDWWSTVDLGSEIDKLATSTPFDYLEHAAWDGARLAHRLELGYPTIGSPRPDLRLALGENVAVTPVLDGDDDDYASEVHALGAGEGRAMVRASLSRATGGVRRVVTYADKTARSQAALSAAARVDLEWRDGAPVLESLTVVEHPNADLSSLVPGVQVFVTGSVDGVVLDRWVRVVEVAMSPEAGRAVLSVVEV